MAAVSRTKRPSRRGHRLTTLILWMLTIATLVPLAVIVLTALTSGDELAGGFALPSHLIVGNFARAWTQGAFGNHLKVSAGVTLTIVAVCGVGSILGGYALGALRVPGERIIFPLFLLGIVIPYEALIIPLYYRLRSYGLTDTYWALILPQSALSLSFGIYWMRGFFRSVPRSLVEAARIDGASSFRVLWHVMVPIAAPAITTMAILTFMWNWNEFLLPVVMMSTDGRQPAPVALAAFQGRFDSDVTALAAGSLIVAAPILALYLVLHRRFTGAVLSGAIKG
jgi:raffinose/stachyose/melibiose transport system permease protein